MTLNVVALDYSLLKNKYIHLPDDGDITGSAAQAQAADLIFMASIEDCQIAKFLGDISVPDRAMFDGWAGALPDLEKVVDCMEFFRLLLSPEKQKHDTQPWWIASSSCKAHLIEPVPLKLFTENAHACKFFEILLANIVTLKTAPQYIELGEFLDLSAANDCAIICWNETKN